MARVAVSTLACLACLATSMAARADEPVTAALVSVNKSAVGTLLEARLLANVPARWVERNQIERILGEQELQAAFGPRDAARRVRLGRLLKADVLVLLRTTPARKAIIELTVCETQQGLRLDTVRLPASDDVERDADALAQHVARALAKRSEQTRAVCAVPPFISRDLTRSHREDRVAYRRLVEHSLLSRPGMVVVELEEAQALVKELALADDGTGIRRVPLLFVIGAYRNEGRDDERRVNVWLELRRGEEELGQVDLAGLRPETVADKLIRGVDELLARVDPDAPTPIEFDRDQQVTRLRERAALARRTFDLRGAVELLDAALLLERDSARTLCDLAYTLLDMYDPAGTSYLRALECYHKLVMIGADEQPSLKREIRGIVGKLAEDGRKYWGRKSKHPEISAREFEILSEIVSRQVRTGKIANKPRRFGAYYLHDPRFGLGELDQDQPSLDAADHVSWLLSIRSAWGERDAVLRKMIALMTLLQDEPKAVDLFETLRQRNHVVFTFETPDQLQYAERAMQLPNEGLRGFVAKQTSARLRTPEMLKLAPIPPARPNNRSRTPSKPEVVWKDYSLPAATESVIDARDWPLSQDRLTTEPVSFTDVETGESVRLDGTGHVGRFHAGCLPAGPGVDVLWIDRTLYVMKERGRLRQIWQDRESVHSVCFDGRLVWAITGHQFGMRLLVIDPQSERVWPLSEEDGLPYRGELTRSLAVTGLAPGKVCVCGASGRAWIAIVTFDPARGAQVDVIHEALERPDKSVANQFNSAHMAFEPTMIHTLRGEPDAEGASDVRVLIGRSTALLHPLVVDPQTLQVRVVSQTTWPDERDAEQLAYDGKAIYFVRWYSNAGGQLYRLGFPDFQFKMMHDDVPVGLIGCCRKRLEIIGAKWWSKGAGNNGYEVRDPYVPWLYPKIGGWDAYRLIDNPSLVSPHSPYYSFIPDNWNYLKQVSRSEHYGLLAFCEVPGCGKPRIHVFRPALPNEADLAGYPEVPASPSVRRYLPFATPEFRSDLVDLVGAELAKYPDMAYADRDLAYEVMGSSFSGSRNLVDLGRYVQADMVIQFKRWSRYGDSPLRVDFCDTRSGAVLGPYGFPYPGDGPRAVARQCAELMRRIQRQFHDGVRHIVVVKLAEMPAQNLGPQPRGYVPLVERSLECVSGLAAIGYDYRGAASCARRTPLPGESPVPLTEVDVVAPRDSSPGLTPNVNLTLHVKTGDEPSREIAFRNATVDEFLAQLPREVLGAEASAGARPYTRFDLAHQLVAAADSYATVDARYAAPLREAALILNPNIADQRLLLWNQHFKTYRPFNQHLGKARIQLKSSQSTPEEVTAARNTLRTYTDDLIRYWHLRLDHLAYLLARRQITLEDANSFLESLTRDVKWFRSGNHADLEGRFPLERKKFQKYLRDIAYAAPTLDSRAATAVDRAAEIGRWQSLLFDGLRVSFCWDLETARATENTPLEIRNRLPVIVEMVEHGTEVESVLCEGLVSYVRSTSRWGLRESDDPSHEKAARSFHERLRRSHKPSLVFCGRLGSLLWQGHRAQDAETAKRLLAEFDQLQSEYREYFTEQQWNILDKFISSEGYKRLSEIR